MYQLAITKTSILDAPINHDSVQFWATKYFHLFVLNASEHTQRAKKLDLEKFLGYFFETMRSETIDLWTPALTRGFQNHLLAHESAKTKGAYCATTINRILATIRHFGNWLHVERPLLAGDPFTGVKLTQVEEPSWNGLTITEITRLKAACDIRLKSCEKGNQNPLLEVTIFYVLLMTGLRESELARLNYGQYYARGFHEVKRKGNKVSKKILVPNEAREYLDKLLVERIRLLEEKGRGAIEASDPLFISRYDARISTRDIARVCDRIAKQASAHSSDRIHLTPHMLRHTFLKRVADKHGVHIAQDLSGNISMREIFRYTKPSAEQKRVIVEGLY